MKPKSNRTGLLQGRGRKSGHGCTQVEATRKQKLRVMSESQGESLGVKTNQNTLIFDFGLLHM